MPEGLKPCPFCGYKEDGFHKIKLVSFSDNLARVICKSCGTAGPFVEGDSEDIEATAIAAWNKRAEVKG